ncbi:transcriptional regulator [Rhizobium ruizarguesonis]|uniref:transcriptional regulator n=1 Tax=Rhizobium ruizarguesonis TaxID=2081791 RepID=UPI0013DF9C32|nr:transcriptional regulator [Rhizobium ruizarguesonis]NEI82134.1 transcriptional regulator [Rhizobium ruizarguesonis]
MARTWNRERAKKRITTRLAEVEIDDVEIRSYVRNTNLHNLPAHVAYRVDGVHLYADILNLKDMLNVTDVEGETCHRRTLRFLNLHYRAVHRLLQRVDALFVDFHNQRLHAVVTKPYDSETDRLNRAVAIAQLIIDVLKDTGEDADHPSAKVRVGIDTGVALAVSNGRRGHREPLFLGEPANHAAKRAGGGRATGIFLTNKARLALGLKEVESPDIVPLATSEVESAEQDADLDVSASDIVAEWKEDLAGNPIGTFSFSGHTPPFSTLDIEALSVRNSRRQDAVAVYADIDNFTRYVGANIGNDTTAKDLVRVLHVLRSELDSTLHKDFSGRKVRFIGDCIHGLLVEGTAQTTDVDATISNMTLCAGALRSSFGLAVDLLADAGTDASSLGLAIGFEFGPMTVTRLGVKGGLVRCSVSRGVIEAEKQQARCSGSETAIGPLAYSKANDAVRSLFGDNRKKSGLNYDDMVEELKKNGDQTAKAAAAFAGAGLLKPASAAANPFTFQNRPSGPAKKDGFS